MLVIWLPVKRRFIVMLTEPSTSSAGQAPPLITARARMVGVRLVGWSPYCPLARAAGELPGPSWIQLATMLSACAAPDTATRPPATPAAAANFPSLNIYSPTMTRLLLYRCAGGLG